MSIDFMPTSQGAVVPANNLRANHIMNPLIKGTNLLNMPGKKSYVSDLSKINFNKDFNNVKNVTWKRTGDFDVATFTKNGKRMNAYFGMQSELIGTISNKTYADLPAEGRKEIADQYHDYAIGQVVYFKTYTPNDNFMVLYGTQIENADNYYVELTKGKERIVVRVNPLGNVSYFRKLT
jgi:hypothetical protein